MAASSVQTLTKAESFNTSVQKAGPVAAMEQTMEALDVLFHSSHTVPQIEELRECMRTYAECEAKLNTEKMVLGEMRAMLQNKQAPPTPDYVEFFRTRVNALAEKNPKPHLHTEVKNFEHKLQKLQSQAEEEAEIEMLSHNINTKCPIIMAEYEMDGPMMPMKSKTCGHTFSKEGITRTINQNNANNRKTRCPVQGCSNYVTLRDLVVDKEMIIRINRGDNEHMSD